MAERLRFVKGAQRLGLGLRAIRELLEILERGLRPCGYAEALLRRRLGEIDAEVARLRDMRRELARMAERFPEGACPEPDAGSWPCEREFVQMGR